MSDGCQQCQPDLQLLGFFRGILHYFTLSTGNLTPFSTICNTKLDDERQCGIIILYSADVNVPLRLNDPDRWHSHAHGIDILTLRNELKLKIDDFLENPQLNDAIKKHYELLRDYLNRQK